MRKGSVGDREIFDIRQLSHGLQTIGLKTDVISKGGNTFLSITNGKKTVIYCLIEQN